MHGRKKIARRPDQRINLSRLQRAAVTPSRYSTQTILTSKSPTALIHSKFDGFHRIRRKNRHMPGLAGPYISFPEMKGFSCANLMYMRAFADARSGGKIVRQAAG